MAKSQIKQTSAEANALNAARGMRAFQLLVAWRYLFRNWLSYLAMVGVMLSVMVLIVVMSVMIGFDEELRSRIRGTLAHLIVEASYEETFGDYESLMTKVESLDEVVSCSPHLAGPCLIKVGRSYRWGQFAGIDLKREASATDFEEYWREGMGEQARNATQSILRRLKRVFEELGAGSPTNEAFGSLDTILANSPRLKELDERQRAGVEAELTRYREAAVEQAGAMRPPDFERLTEEDRALLTAWAKTLNVDLAAKMAETAQKPVSWGPPDLIQDERVAPCIAGRDVVVTGRDVWGDERSLGFGDEVAVVVPLGIDERGVKRCSIAGKFKSGMYEYDSRQIYLPLDVVQRLMRHSGKVSSINVRLRDYARSKNVRAQILGILTPAELAGWFAALRPALDAEDLPEAKDAPGKPATLVKEVERDLAKLRGQYEEWMAEGNPLAIQFHNSVARRLTLLAGMVRELPEARSRVNWQHVQAAANLLADREKGGIGDAYRVWTWEDKRRNTLRAVWLERRILGIILFLLILVSGFVILSILHTTVMAKTKDIGILKAIGARVRGIMTVFLLNGLFIGVIGSALGTLAGCALAAYLNPIEDVLANWFGFRLFPRDVYSLDKIPTAQDPASMIVTVSVLAVIVAFLSALYPAWRAARMDPVETLRYE